MKAGKKIRIMITTARRPVPMISRNGNTTP